MKHSINVIKITNTILLIHSIQVNKIQIQLKHQTYNVGY